MKKGSILRIFIYLAIAISIAVFMTILSAFPPLSIFCAWLERNGLGFVWTGVVAGIVALCLYIYRSRQ